MSNKTIDKKFIDRWSPEYDKNNGDDPCYWELVGAVKKEIAATGVISKKTFIGILEWKSPRLKGIVRLDQFGKYAASIRNVCRLPKKEKFAAVRKLYGFGVAATSTLLNFIYPETFPIMDVRAANALYAWGCLKSATRSDNNYWEYQDVILNIAKKTGKTLRQIDKAFFAWHQKHSGSKGVGAR